MSIRTVAIVTRVLNVEASKGIAALPPPRSFADRAARSCAQTEKVCRQALAMLLEDILSRLLQENRT